MGSPAAWQCGGVVGFRCSMRRRPGTLAAESGAAFGPGHPWARGLGPEVTSRALRAVPAASPCPRPAPWPRPGPKLHRALSLRLWNCRPVAPQELWLESEGILGGQGIRLQPKVLKGSGARHGGPEGVLGLDLSSCSSGLLRGPPEAVAPSCWDSRDHRPSSLWAGSLAKARRSPLLSVWSGPGIEALIAESSSLCGGSGSGAAQAWHWCRRSRRPLVGFPQRTRPAPWVRLLLSSSGAGSLGSRLSGRGPPGTSRERGHGLGARGWVSGKNSSELSL